MEKLSGQIALVTGASQGIGKAIALGLAAQGTTLCLVGRKVEALEAVAGSVESNRLRSRSYGADLTRDEDIEQLAENLRRDFGCLDILVHCAAILFQGPLERAPVAELDAQFRANVRGPYALTQALLPLLRTRHGQIVFINSSVGLQARANVGQYAATKHALKAIADSLRQEINANGVRVLSVYPGRTATPGQEAIFQMEGRIYQPHLLMQPEDVASMVIHTLCLPRTAEVTEIHMRPLMKSY
jgi:NAD(P)-dependent dehydrogenase (short-subunit alcohol dehydrogenase family)